MAHMAFKGHVQIDATTMYSLTWKTVCVQREVVEGFMRTTLASAARLPEPLDLSHFLGAKPQQFHCWHLPTLARCAKEQLASF